MHCGLREETVRLLRQRQQRNRRRRGYIAMCKDECSFEVTCLGIWVLGDHKQSMYWEAEETV
jgi:hypothetical protein